MKRTIQNLTMAAALLLGAAAMSSCAGFVDALLGHEDTPAETPTKPTTSDANDGGSHEGSDMSLPPGAGFNRVDLSTLTEDYTFKDGDVLTGTLDGTKTVIKLSVAPGAKVILSGAQILGKDQGQFVNKWAGLTCLGNATIILDGENTVRSFNRNFPCIQAGPEGSKLIVAGDGKLTTEGSSLAGIGSTENITCGDIEIQGGDLTLKDSDLGIGSEGYSSCGNITISGGIISTQGGGVGIGCKGYGSCGNITISGGTIMAQGDNVGIGCYEYESSCGDITITGGTITAQCGDVGIGCGFFCSCGDIIITSGTIMAQGDNVGIGCYEYESSCGDIIITGGTITAQGDNVGIGCYEYESSCGDITITGGTITVQSGEVGIGSSGYKSSCGDISISWSENFVSLTAIKDDREYPVIGTSYLSNGGQITFDGENIGVDNGGIYRRLKLTISTTLPEGVDETDEEAVKPYKDNTWTLTPKYR